MITSVIILDPVLGVVKGDIGIKDGRIVAVGKAGNPDIMDGVTRGLVDRRRAPRSSPAST